MAKFRAAAIIAAVNKAKDYARQNPEKTSDAIGRVEGFVRGKAGPQHAQKVDKGGEALRKGLGIPTSGGPGSRPADGGTPPPPPPVGRTDGAEGTR